MIKLLHWFYYHAETDAICGICRTFLKKVTDREGKRRRHSMRGCRRFKVTMREPLQDVK